MNDKVAVFGQRRAGVYLLSEIYNPDEVKSSVQNVNKVVPAVGSLVVDDSVTEHNTLYVVYSVDATTFKTTLVPAALAASTDTDDDKIVTYGNNIYMLFYEKKTGNILPATFATGVTYYTRTGSGTTEDPYVYTAAVVGVGADVIANTYYTRAGSGTTADPYVYTLVPAYQSKTLHELKVDNKISIFGESAATFSIYKGSSIVESSTNPIVTDYCYGYELTLDTVFLAGRDYYTRSGEGTILSPYVYTKATVVVGATIPASTYYIYHLVKEHRAPMDKIVVPTTSIDGDPITTNARMPEVAYSETEITSDETYTFVAYDLSGRIIAQITLISHEVLAISSLAAQQSPIESFTITSNQPLTDVPGYQFLTRGQNVDELHFYANIIYASGEHRTSIEIDNTKLFIYGVEDISTATPNAEFTVLFKYFLGNGEKSVESATYSIGETGRYIYTTTKVKIINPTTSKISKIAPILTFDGTNKYKVTPVIYFTSREQPQLCPNQDPFITPLDGDLYKVPQAVKFVTYEQLSESTTQSPFYQTNQITLFNPDTVEDGVHYYFRDEPSSTGNFYGKNTVNMPRPRIYHTATTTSSVTTHRYYISKEVFQNEQMFLNSFYFNADPPKLSGESIAPTPTHFRVRMINPDTVYVLTEDTQFQANKVYYKRTGSGTTADPYVYTPDTSIVIGATVTANTYYELHNGTIPSIIATPIAISSYYSDLPFTQAVYKDTYFGTVIVEFLYKNAEGTYQCLYGVPVDVINYTEEEEEIGDVYRGDIYFAHCEPETANITQFKLAYDTDQSTSTSRGFHRSWKYSADGVTITLSYDKTSGKWKLVHSGASKTWEVATTDPYADVLTLDWNNTTNWVYKNVVTLSKTALDIDLVQYIPFDLVNSVQGILTTKPTINAPAKYITDASKGTYLKLVNDSTSTPEANGSITTAIHTGWTAWDKNFTMEMWVKLTYKDLCQAIFSSDTDYQIAVGTNVQTGSGKYHLMLSDYEAAGAAVSWLNGQYGYEGTEEATADWQHIALTHNASTKTYVLYINGLASATATPTTEASTRPRWYTNALQIGKWANLSERVGKDMCIHAFCLRRSVKYTTDFIPNWDVTQEVEPSVTDTITTTQLDEESRQEPHYKVEIGSWTNNTNRSVRLYLNGQADDCIEIGQVDGSTYTVLWTDHDATVHGTTHTYSNQRVCIVPAGASIKIYVWDTAYNNLKWQGTVTYKTIA